MTTTPGEWYVDAARTRVVWASAVVGNVATIEIIRLVRYANGSVLTQVWARAGTAVSAARVAAAKAMESDATIPTDGGGEDPDPPPGDGTGGATSEELAALSAQVTALSTQVGTSTALTEALAAQVVASTAQVTGLATQVTASTAQTASLSTQVTTLTGTTGTLSTQVTGLSAQVTSMAATLAQLW